MPTLELDWKIDGHSYSFTFTIAEHDATVACSCASGTQEDGRVHRRPEGDRQTPGELWEKRKAHGVSI